MTFASIFYRLRQFRTALRTPPLTQQDFAPAQAVLTEAEMALFSRLQSCEQTHALNVLQTIQTRGENHPDLLTAALLHDIGKIGHPLRIWERVIIVLGKKFFPERMKTWGRARPQGWRRPFVVAFQHPLWGTELTQKVGASPLAVHLIRTHQDEIPSEEPHTLENYLLKVLQAADNQN